MLSCIKYVFVFCTFILFAEINFTDPAITTGDGGSPNLSNNGQNAENPQIVTNSTGKYVYAIWRRYDGSNYIIQVAISSDSGINWFNPKTTTGDGGSPNLSDNGQNAFEPQIATDSTGKYVYVTWRRFDGLNYIIQIAISPNYGVNWVNPDTTTGNGGSPNLSDNGQNARNQQIATDSNGEHVYVTWRRYDGSNYIIQVAISANYGVTWINPTTTTGDGGSPNLSDNLQDADDPQIATDSTGEYVYVTWTRFDGSNYIIQVAISTGLFGNFGDNWIDPATTTGDGGSPNLSDNGQNAFELQIATNSTGKFVYVIWTRFDGSNDIIQVAISSDSGVNWFNPNTTTGDGGTPNLSDNGEDALEPQIAIDSTGKFVYVTWRRYDGSNYIIQVAISSDSGVNWIDPTTTTGDGGTPNLSDNGQNAFEPQIATDSTGRYVHVTWTRFDGSNYIIQAVISSDIGDNWIDPATTTGDGGSPNLSDNGQDASEPQITTDSTGKFVYVIWHRFDSSNYIIQITNGIIISKIHFPIVIRPKRWTGSLLFPN